MSLPVVTRTEFQALADVRLAESKTLLDAGQWDGAYYLAGYAVELALKACIIKLVMATDAFPRKGFSHECYTHELHLLVGLAGLSTELVAARKANVHFNSHWLAALEWSEQKRYHRVSEAEARALYDAVSDAAHGVLPWIKTYW